MRRSEDHGWRGAEGAESPSMASFADALADRALSDFAAEFRAVFLRKLTDRRDQVLQVALASLLE